MTHIRYDPIAFPSTGAQPIWQNEIAAFAGHWQTGSGPAHELEAGRLGCQAILLAYDRHHDYHGPARLPGKAGVCKGDGAFPWRGRHCAAGAAVAASGREGRD